MLFSSNAQLPPVAGVDIIGDVHGCAVTLERLLKKLDYTKVNGVYQHPERRVIFLGDIIDRGPRIREALLLVRSMVEHGSAELILGNHEFNALLYCEKSAEDNAYLRSHSARHHRQIAETLHQFSAYADEWVACLDWFKTCPLFLEFTNEKKEIAFRCVHACWDQELINFHRHAYPSGLIDDEFIALSANNHSIESRVRQRLMAGVDIPLPEGTRVVSKDGYERDSFRTTFWSPYAKTYGDVLFQPDPLPRDLAASEISHEHRKLLVHYHEQEPPLFVGHYWLRGKPKPLANNIACLDYSAVKYGRLAAYRMDGERQLSAKKFVWEYVDP